MLNDGPRDTDHVGFLERIFTNQVALHLTGNDHHGNGVHVGRRDAPTNANGVDVITKFIRAYATIAQIIATSNSGVFNI